MGLLVSVAESVDAVGVLLYLGGVCAGVFYSGEALGGGASTIGGKEIFGVVGVLAEDGGVDHE